MAKALWGSSGSSDGDFTPTRSWTKENTRGRISRVAAVANNNPPITARPRGVVCWLPSPIPVAMGIIPAIMAMLVIKIGLMRV